MNKRILTIGPLTKDYIITPNDKYFQIGGAVFYQTVVLSRLKFKVSSIISMSKDDLKFVDDMKTQADIHYIFTNQTMQYTNIYDENFNRTQKAILPENPIYPEQIKIKLDDITNVLLSPLSPYDIPPETIKYFKQANIRTILVPQGLLRQTDEKHNVIERRWDNISEYLKYVDIICLDELEAKKSFNLVNINDETVMKLLEKYSLEQIIITKAQQGSTIYTNENIFNIPAIKTENEVDATGLGDTYIAAYIAKLEETDNIREAGLFASVCAKEKLENKGPFQSTKEKIEKELDNHR